jgi:hypothetical protein
LLHAMSSTSATAASSVRIAGRTLPVRSSRMPIAIPRNDESAFSRFSSR